MSIRRARCKALGLAALLGACSLLGACASPEPEEQALPCEVGAVLENVCQRCHSRPPRAGVPLSLVTYADTQAMFADPASGMSVPTFQIMGELLRAGTMPQPPETITGSQKNALLGWIDDGALPAPPGNECP